MANFRQLHKFGGSSLANPECYQRVVSILKEYSSENRLGRGVCGRQNHKTD